MDEHKEHMGRLNIAAGLVRDERRFYNRMLQDSINGKHTEYNLEDLMRLVGTLEATYNHLLASLASDGDIYCVLKHLSYAIVLAGELDMPDVSRLYTILSIVTNGKLEACDSCKREEVVGAEDGRAELNQA